MDDSTQPPGLNGGAPIDIHQPFTPGERIQQLSETDQDIASLLVHLSAAMRALATPPGGTVPTQTTTASTNGHGNNNKTTSSDVPILDSTEPAADDDDNDPVSAFNAAQSSFFNTLDRVDKHLTRQILALEEAGIITLRNNAAAAAGGGGGGGAAAGAGDAGQPGEAAAGGLSSQQPGAAGGDADKGRVAGPRRLEPDGMGRYGTLDVGKLNMASSTVERDMERELWRRAREELTRVVGESGGGDGERMEE